MNRGSHIVQTGLDMLSLILPTFPCHLIQMPSQNSQACKKFAAFAMLPFPCIRYIPHFFVFFLLKKREEISVPNSL